MKYKGNIIEFCENELGDYPFFEGWRIVHEDTTKRFEYYSLIVRDNKFYNLFRVNEHGMQVQINEDSYEDVKWWDWQVKHFWQAILDWEYLI